MTTNTDYIHISYSAETIVRMLGLDYEQQGDRIAIACVVHRGDDKNLKLGNGVDGYLGDIKCHSRGCNAKDVRREFARYLGIDTTQNASPAATQGVQCTVCNSRWRWDWIWLYETADGQHRCAMRYDCRGRDCKFRERRGSVMQHPDETKHVRGGSPKGCLVRMVNDKPDNIVVLVEGEKAADAHLLDGYTFACWKGGTDSVGHADYAPLVGRRVILWPDDDTQGREAMDAAYEVAGSTWASIKIIRTEGETKRDAADYTMVDALAALEAAELVTVPVAPVSDEMKGAWGAALGLPTHLHFSQQPSQRLDAEVDRILRYMPEYILRLYTPERDALMIRQVDGLWAQLTKRTQSLTAVLHLVEESRDKARAEIKERLIDQDGVAEAYISEWDTALNSTPRYLTDVTVMLIARVWLDIASPAVEIGEMGNCHSTGIVPLINGLAYDLNEDMIIDGGDEIGAKRLLDYSWAIREPDLALTSQPTDPDAVFMKEVIEQHWGLGIIWDMAYALVSTTKTMVFYRNAVSNAGKDTLMDAVRSALGRASVVLGAKRSFSEQAVKFTQMESALAEHALVFLNEMGTLEETSAGIINLLDRQRLTVEKKRENAIHDMPRVGTVFMVGAFFPEINMSHQGVPERIGHCHDIVSDRVISKYEREILLRPMAVAYLRALLFQTASDMKRNGTGWYESQPQWTAADLARLEYIEDMKDDRIKALHAAFEPVRGGGFVANELLARAITDAGEEAPKGKGLASLIRTAFPRAKAVRQSGMRGYAYLQPRVGVNDETDRSETDAAGVSQENEHQATL